MKINDAAVIAEVRVAFDAYETALLANDNSTLETFFLEDDSLVRYGLADIQHGFDEVRAWRKTQAPFARDLERLVIATFGDDFATAWTQFRRADCPGEIGRQSQVWLKTPGGWKIVAAHVSMMPDPA